MNPTARTCLALLACLSTSACAVLDVRFQRLPPAEAFQAVKPGSTNRSQVLALLGPPEDFRRPGVGEGLRLSTPWEPKLVEAGDVFGRDVFTYATERRRVTRAGILPFLITLFRVTHVRSVEERWRIEFDAQGIVRQIAYVDEGVED